jgi:hypothetical protein
VGIRSSPDARAFFSNKPEITNMHSNTIPAFVAPDEYDIYRLEDDGAPAHMPETQKAGS